MSGLLSIFREHKLIFALVGCTAVADVSYYSLQNWILPQLATRYGCTKSGSTDLLPASEDLHARLRTVSQQLGIDVLVRRPESLRLFVCRDVNPVRLGRLSTAEGSRAFLGLPEYYNYKASDTELRSSFLFDDRPVSLNTKKGKQLYKDCLLLSDDEKAFVLAREMLYITSSAVHVKPLAGSVAATGLCGTFYWLYHSHGRQIIEKIQQTKNGAIRAVLRGGLPVAITGLWAVMAYQWYAAYCKSLDARVDRRAAVAFPAGAVSFYQKQVKRNTLLYAMLGEKVGKDYFTVKGNEVHNWILSDPFLPVNQRWSKLKYDQTLKSRDTATAAVNV